MLYSYNLLQSFIKQKLVSANQLNDTLNNCLGDTHFKKVSNDYVFDIELTANRIGVLAGHKNMAKEICAMLDLDLKAIKDYKIGKIAKPILMSVKNNAKASCQIYSGIVLTNIKIKESPSFIKDALNNCGMRSINNVVDITNYVMLEIGQPMHAFDYEKIEGNKINVRYAKKDETITVLTGDEYKLNEDILVIADQTKPMAIAGIKGGIAGEIDKNTKTIVLESANFNSVDIYKASKFLNLATDASVRFSHKLSPSLAREALKRAVELFEKYANAKVVSNVLETGVISDQPLIVPFNLERVTKLIGQSISEKDIQRILTKLGYTIKKISSKL
jgi:phenylalanyl-tRNA synthetase beta chain